MSEEMWQALALTLAEGPPVSFWLRDDDAIAVTPALERLGALCEAARAPLLLAAIPAGVTAPLGAWTAARPGVTPCQHGYAHRNHAAAGTRACELGGDRDDGTVLAELSRGRARMDAVFGDRWAEILVPPWNRIRDSLVPALSAHGFSVLSTFAGAAPRAASGPPALDCDLDIIDWRHGRRGRDAGDLCRRLTDLIGAARRTGRPIGILTHHLAHDDVCWAFLGRLLPMLARHPGAELVDAAEALRLTSGSDRP